MLVIISSRINFVFYLILLAVGSDEPVTAYLVFELWSSRFPATPNLSQMNS